MSADVDADDPRQRDGEDADVDGRDAAQDNGEHQGGDGDRRRDSCAGSIRWSGPDRLRCGAHDWCAAAAAATVRHVHCDGPRASWRWQPRPPLRWSRSPAPTLPAETLLNRAVLKALDDELSGVAAKGSRRAPGAAASRARVARLPRRDRVRDGAGRRPSG